MLSIGQARARGEFSRLQLGIIMTALLQLITARGLTAQDGANGDRTLIIDLASPGAVAVSVTADTRYRVAALHALPGIEYALSETVEWQEITDLPRSQGDTAAVSSSCPIRALYDSIRVARTEVAVKPHVRQIQVELSMPDTDCDSAEIEAGKLAIARTRREWIVGPYERGQVITLSLTRPGVDAAPAPVWIRVLSTPEAGSWEVTSGFGFIWQQWSPPDRYLSRDSADVFTVTKARNQRPLAFTPTLVFRWAEPAVDRRGFSWDRLVAGLGIAGFDASNPFVAIASGTTYRRNLSLHVGVAVHGVQRLNDRYVLNQVLKESLDEQQLHERSLAVNPYLSLSLRLSGNPFGGSENDTKVAPAPSRPDPG